MSARKFISILFFLPQFFVAFACIACMVRPATAIRPQLRLIKNSTGISQVLDLANDGSLIGSKEVPLKGIGFETRWFFDSYGTESEFPSLSDFTSLQVFRISDNRRVAGLASRTIGHPKGSLRAAIWHMPTGDVQRLPLPALYLSSVAMDISSDGNRLSGYLVGNVENQPRMIPCVWIQSVVEPWQCETLPVPDLYNPALNFARVVISDDGRTIASCIDTDPREDIRKNVLTLWSQQLDGGWTRRAARTGSMRLANVNNDGTVVGTMDSRGRSIGFVFDNDAGLRFLEPLDGDISTQLLDVNNLGIAVGFSDDPPGPDGGPEAIVWQNGQITRLDFGRPAVFGAATTINDRGQIGGYATLANDKNDSESTQSFVLQWFGDNPPVFREKR